MKQSFNGVIVLLILGFQLDCFTAHTDDDLTEVEELTTFSQEFVHPPETEGEENEILPEFHPTEYEFNDLGSKVTEFSNCICGVQPHDAKSSETVTPLIYGGSEAEVNEFPWVVALIQRHEFPNGTILKRHFCGGSLINNRFVLTAQHCLLGMNVNQTEVWINEHDLLLSTETCGKTIKRQAVTFILHPNYNKFMHYNDLALIELDEDIDISDSRLRSVCLPKEPEMLQSEAITAGWGQVWFEGPKSDKLLRVELPIITNSECINSSVAYYKRRVTEHSICAGDLQHGQRDTCPGDSGGGLFARNSKTGNYEIVGICSFGVRCGEIMRPGVYTRVFKYLQWIQYESRIGRQCRS